MSAVSGRIAEARTLVDGIAAAGRRQADAVREVTEGTTAISAATQEAAASAVEAAQTATALSGEAGTLHALLGRFRLAAE
jgi:methyl-accepting chemotaxis protein